MLRLSHQALVETVAWDGAEAWEAVMLVKEVAEHECLKELSTLQDHPDGRRYSMIIHAPIKKT